MYMDQKNDVFFNFFFFLYLKFFFDQMTPNTNKGFFSVELCLFYYILKKKDCVYESGPKNIDFKIKVFFGFFLTILVFCRRL
jgi:hypothetical protein